MKMWTHHYQQNLFAEYWPHIFHLLLIATLILECDIYEV